MDPSWSWLPWTEDLHPTSDTTVVGLDLSVLDGIDSIFPEFNEQLKSVFFRIAAATSSLPQVIISNRVALRNQSSNTLSHVSLSAGREFDKILITNFNDLAVADSTPYVTLSSPLNNDYNWYMRYTQDGTEREAFLGLIGWGPPDKAITVIVSNSCYILDFSWIESHWRVNY